MQHYAGLTLKLKIMRILTPFKKLAKAEIWFSAFIATLSILAGLPALAQTTVPEKVDVNINAGGDGGGSAGGWYAQPWVWVVGVAVFIIIIIAITRSGNTRRDV
jgi:hypothetical protein